MTLLDRVRRLYQPALTKPGAGMSSGQFVRWAKEAGVFGLRGITKPDLEIIFARLCGRQEWDADQPAQRFMRLTTFVTALVELGARAFPEVAEVGGGLLCLLDAIE